MTRLSALELFGFKSFADRTRFEFPDGITVVVGPNGSGKSNVVDAIKWVLGEQSVRSLRGKEMTDVIFAGSATRKPLNMAEVSLCFDNTTRQLSVATDEVRISRRVYRNGESEYLINGEPTRLRDIRELLSGTGAATEAYSVIEQGRVDALLVASGRDRRAVFEEAAGITRFRTRRTEALRRLERAEQNRQRLADIVGEVAARLETVRHQAARARRWRTMQDRLRRLRLTAAGRDLAGVDATLAALEESLATVRSALVENEARSTAATADSAAIHDRQEATQPLLAAARAAAVAETQRDAAATAAAAVLRGRRDALDADQERTAADVANAIEATRQAERAATAARAAAAAMEAAVAAIVRTLATREAAAAGSLDDAASAREALAAATVELDDRRARHLRFEADHERAMAAASAAREAAREAREAAAAARQRRAALGESRAACEGHLRSLEHRLRDSAAAVETGEAEHRRAKAALQNAWRDLAGWQAACEAGHERIALLRDLVARQEGMSDAARSLLADHAAAIPGLAGVLADHVIAGVDWAALVDVALGELGQSLVVRSLDDALAWHAAWSADGGGDAVLAAGGRIGFLDPGVLRAPEPFEPPPHPGIVGRLDRLVLDAPGAEHDDDASSLLHRLLGRVWVVERIDHALPLAPTAPAGTLFVTRAGATLTAGGTFAIGAASATAGLVARRSELRALEERQHELTAAVDAGQAEVDRLQAAVATAEDEIAQAVARRQKAAETIATARAEIALVGRDEAAADDAITAAEQAVRSADQRAAASESAATTSRQSLDAAAAEHTRAAEEVARCQLSIEAVERDRGAAIDEVHRLKVEQAATAEKLTRCRDHVSACERLLADRRADIAAAENRLSDARGRHAAHELDELTASAVVAETSWAAERATTVLAALDAEAASIEALGRSTAATLDETRSLAARLAEQGHQLELEAGEARHQRARIVERIRDDYGLDIEAEAPPADSDDDAVPEDRGDLEAQIEELRRKLASMTSVNLEALQEAEELASRLTTLETQLADVTGAKDSIEQLIARIDEESRRLLGETIETVRGHFRDLFERVFGGGQADIVLEPDVDLLETSVEIVARPPGKEPRSISLLSGGEKTMTCVSLLLAIFKSRPSPFCVLDEVDAALDEANVDRFVGVLRDFLSSTQFIVVTHSKKTMASATTLYGVTMEESGVSKRVSVRFESTAAASRPASRAA
ncbi:MAG: chromosome segregation protein SMC [Pirellulales bacterium]